MSWKQAVSAAVVALVICVLVSQSFREWVFGPDYYTRSTPAYFGQRPWWR